MCRFFAPNKIVIHKFLPLDFGQKPNNFFCTRQVKSIFNCLIFVRNQTNLSHYSWIRGENFHTSKFLDSWSSVLHHEYCQTMGNLFYNRWRCEQSDQKTSWPRISSIDIAPSKRSCTFFYRIILKENLYCRPTAVTMLAAPRHGLV
jgi:hypothetical protein